MNRILTIAGLASALIATTARADFLYFNRGGQVQLPASIEGDQVHLATPSGPKVFPRADFLAIVPELRVEQEWATRQGAANLDGTVEVRFAAAWWALENGMTSQAIAALEALRPMADRHQPTRRAFQAIDGLALPCNDPDLGPLRARLRSQTFQELRSAHVLLLYQGDSSEAQARLDVIERVVQTFYLAFMTPGLDLTFPRQRFLSVYFADRSDYIQLLQASNAGAFVNTQGYYHPNLRAVFAFDTRTDEDHKRGQRAIANRKRDGASGSDLARQWLLLELAWQAVDLGIVAHETAHQLTVESGLSPHPDDFPAWLHEGIATQFEVIRGGRWAGFGQANDLRLPDWRAPHQPPRLAPLVRDTGFGQGYRRDLYAQAWALVNYLRHDHPREFVGYLEMLRAPRSREVSRSIRGFESFRKAFGVDLAACEKEWHRYLDKLKTPIESARPRPLDPKSRLVEADPAH